MKASKERFQGQKGLIPGKMEKTHENSPLPPNTTRKPEHHGTAIWGL